MIKIPNNCFKVYELCIYFYYRIKLKNIKPKLFKLFFKFVFRVVFLPNYLQLSVQKQSMDYNEYILTVTLKLVYYHGNLCFF